MKCDAGGILQYHVENMVQVQIDCYDHSIYTETLIMKENIPTLLSGDDAKALRVLKVGFDASKSK